MKDIHVGLVGFGMGGRVFHAPILTSVEGLVLKKIAARNPEQKVLANHMYPEVEVVNDLDDLLADETLQLIVIATQNTEHFNLASKAISAGKNVVVEKPFTVTSDEALKLMRLAEEKGVLLSVHHNRRFDADFLTLQKLIQDDALGKVLTYEARFDRFRKDLKGNSWREADRPGSGLAYDLGSHLIDQALVLFGLPEYVTGYMAAQRNEAVVDDYFEIHLDYADKRITLTAGNMVRNHQLRYTIHGTNATFIKGGIDVQEEKMKAGQCPKNDGQWGVEPTEQYGKLMYEEQGVLITKTLVSEEGDYRLYYEDIKGALLENRTPYVTAQDGYHVIKVIEYALRSHQEKRSLRFEL